MQIEFLKLCACLVRIKGRHALKLGMCSYSNSDQGYSIVARQRTSVGFKLAVHGDTGGGGLVAPLPCTAYFGKLAMLFGCLCHNKHWPSQFVLLSQPSLTYNLARLKIKYAMTKCVS